MRKSTGFGSSVSRAVLCYLVSCVIVLAGITTGLVTGGDARRRSPDRVPLSQNRFRDTFTQWDGQWYQKIAMEGYSYNRDRMSSVAFFPLYPLAGRAVAAATGLPMDLSLLAVSHLLLVVAACAWCVTA